MTTFDLLLDDDHDIHLSGQDLALAEEEDIVVQRLKIRLQFLQEEWFLDVNAGLPYTQTIFEAGTSIDDVYALYQSEIINTTGVETINELNLTPTAESKLMRVDTTVNQSESLTLEVTP
jgi:hypothetical protein